jgi:signal transduction histidine kinase
VRSLLVIAALLAAGMVAAGVTAGRVLRERDAAVREGVLARASHSVESELRQAGPEAAEEILRDFRSRHPEVSAIEITDGERSIVRDGVGRGDPVEVPLALGPGWRALLGDGPGEPRRMPPFRMRLWPGEGLGDSSRLASAATWGSIAGAVALLAFGFMAARNIDAKHRAAELDAERRRLELVALAGSGLAHRIRNPLATMKATAQILEATLEGVQRDRAQRIAAAAGRTEALLDELLRFARPVEPRPELLDLGAIVAQFADEAVVTDTDSIRVQADREHVIAAIEELLTNARAFDDHRPEIGLLRRGRNAVIEIRDRGPGLQIAPDKAFDPYVTTRPDGAGLGLPTIAALIQANGGTVALQNREGGGAVATITLPEERA